MQTYRPTRQNRSWLQYVLSEYWTEMTDWQNQNSIQWHFDVCEPVLMLLSWCQTAADLHHPARSPQVIAQNTFLVHIAADLGHGDRESHGQTMHCPEHCQQNLRRHWFRHLYLLAWTTAMLFYMVCQIIYASCSQYKTLLHKSSLACRDMTISSQGYISWLASSSTLHRHHYS